MESIITKALKFAEEKHMGQFRKSGEPYVEHPKRVAQLVGKYKKSHKINELIAAAYLHDTLEDTNTTIEELQNNFGELVTKLVIELTNDEKKIKLLGKTQYLSEKLSNIKKVSSWALVIKLADRLDNVSDLDQSDNSFRLRYISETTEILKNLEQKRDLSATQKRLIVAIKVKLIQHL